MDDSDELLDASGALWLLAGLMVALLTVVLLVSIALAPLSALADGTAGGAGGFPCVGTSPTSAASTAMSTTAPTHTSSPGATMTGQSTPPSCVSGGPQAAAVVAAALAMAAHLHGNPDVWYDASFPQAVLAYWARTCPGCSEWQNGNLQCVMFVLAAYGVAGLPPPAAGNAVTFWALYAHRPGWIEVPSDAAPPGLRGLPLPGDMMVWYSALEPNVGHIAIVVGVSPPNAGQPGAITFAEANGPGPLVTEPLLPDLSVQTWNHYTVLGYIRPA